MALAIICAANTNAQRIDVVQNEYLSPYVFGHNLEHTRAAVLRKPGNLTRKPWAPSAETSTRPDG